MPHARTREDAMDEEQEYTVRDRRSAASESGPEQPEEQQSPADAPKQGKPDASGTGPLPDLDFSSFIISLAGTAQMSLGLIPHPDSNLAAQNIPAAKQLIDILGILQRKTKGNLTREEETLLEQVLFNLRMHYVRVLESEKKAGGS
jgi:hypothetical protein